MYHTRTELLRAWIAALASTLPAVCIEASAQVPANPFSYGRTTSYTYFTSADGAKHGAVRSETTEPGSAPSCVSRVFDYDSYGNQQSVAVGNCPNASGMATFSSRSSRSTYEGAAQQTVIVGGVAKQVSVLAGVFPNQFENAVGHLEQMQFDPRFGAQTQQSGPNQLATKWTFDDLGRPIEEVRTDGTKIATSYCFLKRVNGIPQVDTSVASGSTCPTPIPAEVPADAVAFVHREGRGSNDIKNSTFVRTYTDRLGREIRSVSEAFDGESQTAAYKSALTARDTVFGRFGTKDIETQPYFLSSRSSTTTGNNDVGVSRVEYDVLGRAVAIYSADPTGAISSVAFGEFGARRASSQTVVYRGAVVLHTNELGQTRKHERNAIGKVVRVTDGTGSNADDGAQAAYQHDAFGNLVETKDALQNRTSIAFDVRGRRVRLSDASLGMIEYCHDALGQRKAERNPMLRGGGALGCIDVADIGTSATAVPGWTTFAYDKLGRMTQRSEREYVTSWYFDKLRDGSGCGKSAGKLCETSTSHGVNRRTHYDSLGRPMAVRTDVGGGPAFATSIEYDSRTGKVANHSYPTGLKVGYGYTSSGFLEKLELLTAVDLQPLPPSPGGTPGAAASLPANHVLWRATVANAWGAAEQHQLGNGVASRSVFDAGTGRVSNIGAGVAGSNGVLNQQYAWDALGNLKSRADGNGDGSTGAVSESFAYDKANRLTGYTVAAPAVENMTYSVAFEYNALGMLLYKSDTGAFVYGPQGFGSVRPHAPTALKSDTTSAYGYDANGNLATAGAGKYRSASYTSFNLPDASGGIKGVDATLFTWQYDETHARIKEVRTDASGAVRTTWYLHQDNEGTRDFERETTQSSASNRHFLTVGGATVGVLVSTEALPALGPNDIAPPIPIGNRVSAVKLEYLHKDQQGSVVATSDHAANVTARYAYDAFGRRRYADGKYDQFGRLIIDWNSSTNAGSDIGFTGHEQLDAVGLIHANGRIYDPSNALFLQADPNIGNPYFLQDLNRYSYCANSPLGCVDPSGLEEDFHVYVCWLCDEDTYPDLSGAYGSRGGSFATPVSIYSAPSLSQSYQFNVSSYDPASVFNYRSQDPFSPGGVLYEHTQTAQQFANSMVQQANAPPQFIYSPFPQSPGSSAATQYLVSRVASGSLTSWARLAAAPTSMATGGFTVFAPPIQSPVLQQPVPQAAAKTVGLPPAAALRALTPVGLALTLRGDTAVEEDGQRQVKIWVTYTRVHPLTGMVYSGRTSGFGDPETLVRRRAMGQPLLNAEGFGPPQVDRWANRYDSIRGREQMLIDYYGGARSVGGTARNMINGVSDWRIDRPIYMNAAREEFGDLKDNSPPRFRFNW